MITIEESAETPEERFGDRDTGRHLAASRDVHTSADRHPGDRDVGADRDASRRRRAAIEPGTTVVNADSDANLRAGPSLDAEIIGTIPLGSELAVTGPAEAEGDALWWPVLVVATGEEGYVAEELLTPLGEE